MVFKRRSYTTSYSGHILRADLLSWPAVLSNSHPQANMFPPVTILLQHQSRTVLRRKEIMNSTVLGYVYEIVIFTFSWLLRLTSPMSSSLSEATSNFPGHFEIQCWPLQPRFFSFHFRRVKCQISCKKVVEKKDIAAQDRQVLDIFISIGKRKKNYFWRFCKTLKQLGKHSYLKINGFFLNPFLTWTIGDPWTTADPSHFRPSGIKPIRFSASWQTGTS